MKFGIREICEVVLKAKSTQKVGNKIFYKNEPVIYFDSLKTSTLEGAATTVYATGGRGNARLMAWEGERTITFTMEDALISPAGFMILSGAGLVEATDKKTIKVHTTEQTDNVEVDSEGKVSIILKQKPYTGNAEAHEDLIYVMKMENGEVATEPFIPDHTADNIVEVYWDSTQGKYVTDKGANTVADGYKITLISSTTASEDTLPTRPANFDKLTDFHTGDVVLVDYYVERESNVQQIEITPDKFGGNYYLEASTLFRNTDGVDLPAEFIIPNCKIQSNFSFSMASSGDPSTFTFTMDAFPDYTRFDKTKKVIAAIQIVEDTVSADLYKRTQTPHDIEHEQFFI